MRDRFGREIDYLRISVTDRCNLRCLYCMPEEGVPLVSHRDVLTIEEIVEIAKIAVSMGVTKLRLTGGEPLLRRGFFTLVSQISCIEGVRDLGMTTNGILLEQYARDLFQAGLHRVNVSLDTIREDRYREITRGGTLSLVLAGIRAAAIAGLRPIKINCVVEHSSDEQDAKEVRDFAYNNALEVQFIRRMDATRGEFSVVEGGRGGNCPRCNRLRLSSTGIIKPCLFSDLGFSVRELGAEEALRMALEAKPEAGGVASENWVRVMGG